MNLPLNQATAEKVILGLVLCLLALGQLLFFGYTADDAFISFRYVLNTTAGLGPVFNPGQVAEGFSHPLYFLMLLPAGVLPNSADAVVIWSKVLGISGTMVAAILLWLSLRRHGKSVSVVAAGLGMFVAHPGVHLYSVAGLETTVLMGLLVLGFFLEVRGTQRWIVALVFGLASITRPEAMLYPLLWLFWVFLTTGKIPPLLCIVIAWSPLIAWLLFRMAYYGLPLPMPYYAKPAGTFGGKLGIPYLTPIVLGSGLPLALAILFRSLRQESTTHRDSLWLASFLVLPGLALAVYSQGDWMPFGRFLIPAWPFIVYTAAMGVALLPDDWLVRWPCAAALSLMTLLAWAPSVPEFFRGDDLDIVMHGKPQLEAGEWLADRIDEEETVVVGRLGGIAYQLPNSRVLDMLGLTHREVAFHLKRSGGEVNWAKHPLRSPLPDWLALVHYDGESLYHRDEMLTNDAKAFYTFEGSVDQGAQGAMHFYRLKESIDPDRALPSELPAENLEDD